MLSSPYRAVVVGASTGGVSALQALLKGLAPDLRASVLIVQHVAHEASVLDQVLANSSPLPLSVAQARQAVLPGHVYLAPPGYHWLAEREPGGHVRIALSIDDKVCFARPSVDVLFESAADVWGASLIGVVLTGANDDGARGLQVIRRRKGLGIVQDPEDAEMPEMPSRALQRAGADHVLPLRDIPSRINEFCAVDGYALSPLSRAK